MLVAYSTTNARFQVCYQAAPSKLMNNKANNKGNAVCMASYLELHIKSEAVAKGCSVQELT